MIAIYARQSVDRADSISIESQIEACRYEARGEAFQVYQDRGYSGKNTQRPDFQRMMRHMEQGLLSKVVVYRLDRISRSILDFSSMMERFQQYHVAFVSTTEKFDTDSPMGRAMLNICVVFAQLERETIQKRVADAYFSRSQKSFYMGGRVPYGFRLVPTVIDGVKTSMYEICPEEARQVQLIYRMYAEPACSYGDIVRHFQANGITKNGRPWSRARLGELLRNPIYVRADLAVYEFYQSQGAILANDPADFIGTNGCYCYKRQDAQGRKHSRPEGNHLVLAPHEGIVPAWLWLRCRAKCLDAQQVQPCQKAKNTWLAGKIKCGLCGYALVAKHSSAGQCRYFLCSNKLDTKACPGPGCIPAEEVEQLVDREIRQKLAGLGPLRGQSKGPASPELTALGVELAQAEAEIDGLMQRLSTADQVLYRYISGRVGELDREKQRVSIRMAALQKHQEKDCAQIRNSLACWEALDFQDRRQAVHLLIHAVYATGDSVTIQWRI